MDKLDDNIKSNIKRWRLILGKDAQESLENLEKDIYGSDALSMSEEDFLIDKALSDIYGSSYFGDINELNANNGFGYGNNYVNNFPEASKWLGDINNLFDKDIAEIIQNDAIERCGLKDLLLEPDILENMQPNINLASSIMLLKNQIPEKNKDSVRIYIKKIVDDINKKLSDDVRKTIYSKLNKREHSPIPSATAIDFKTTIRKNLKNYNTDLKSIIPEKVYFFEKASVNDANKWNIILDVDKSGSMGESVIYSSVLSSILASINSIKTKIVTFDTEVVDLTDLSSDPVELLYGFNLGGGTDINKSLKYCQTLIENPQKTILFLVTDLYENGNVSSMLKRLEYLKESGVKIVCLLAITDSGKPFYDKNLAQKLIKLSIPCFACSPSKLGDLLEYALNNKSFEDFNINK